MFLNVAKFNWEFESSSDRGPILEIKIRDMLDKGVLTNEKACLGLLANQGPVNCPGAKIVLIFTETPGPDRRDRRTVAKLGQLGEIIIRTICHLPFCSNYLTHGLE